MIIFCLEAVHISHLIFRDITVKGSFMSDTASAEEMVELVVQKGEQSLDLFLLRELSFTFKGIEIKTHVYDLHESDKLLEDYASATLSGKLVFRVSK